MTDPATFDTLVDARDLVADLAARYRAAGTALRHAAEALTLLPDADPDEVATTCTLFAHGLPLAADLLDLAAAMSDAGIAHLGDDPDAWTAALALVEQLEATA